MKSGKVTSYSRNAEKTHSKSGKKLQSPAAVADYRPSQGRASPPPTYSVSSSKQELALSPALARDKTLHAWRSHCCFSRQAKIPGFAQVERGRSEAWASLMVPACDEGAVV